ncbi:hypothetical protein BOTBODRAFT_330621 [Botryobasidium botryosum FD-172 SS1]|uniref:Uncharacterized protein n=1 Tax=Botryobasidium botryosum (strain FD-172 SS1) TaxID=930990 RepID=A0A067MGD3_BOTB1|nr:hypothetical protein BOTBODRAFT_330621 [Botryobasidium botryosum FD-172 SS1]
MLLGISYGTILRTAPASREEPAISVCRHRPTHPPPRTACLNQTHLRFQWVARTLTQGQRQRGPQEKAINGYPKCVFIPPHSDFDLMALVHTARLPASRPGGRFDISAWEGAKAFAPRIISQWEKIRRNEESGTMHACDVVRLAQHDRDMSFICYESMKHTHAHKHSRTPEFVSCAYFGQFLCVFVLELSASPDLHTASPKTLILVLI